MRDRQFYPIGGRLCFWCILVMVWSSSAHAAGRDLGVDVSHFQGSTGISQATWNELAAEGKGFAFIKASEGLTGPDDATMATNVARASSAGVLNGVYHFAHAENRPTPAGAVLEADHLMNYAGSAIGPGHLRPVLDIEGATGNLSTSVLSDWIIAFVNEVDRVRGPAAEPIIYADLNFATNKFDSRLSNYAFWAADGSGATDPSTGNPLSLGVFSNWSFWQYSGGGSAAGISPIDLDTVHSEYRPLSSYLIPEPTSWGMLMVMLGAGTMSRRKPKRDNVR